MIGNQHYNRSDIFRIVSTKLINKIYLAISYKAYIINKKTLQEPNLPTLPGV